MGPCSSKSLKDGGTAEAKTESKRIDDLLQKDMEQAEKGMKLLLLGAGESGKSTVLKQMRLLYGAEYSEDEKLLFKKFIHQNIIETTEMLCRMVRELTPESNIIKTPEYQLLFSEYDNECDFDSSYRVFPELTDITYSTAIKSLWTSDDIQNVWEQRSTFQIIETMSSFMNRIDEIADPDYKPSTNDIMNCRVRTTGIKEERFLIDNKIFQFFDVGGQKNERRKWIHCFDNVHGVIFMAALSEFDQVLWEDRCTNRMMDAIDLFDRTSNDAAFEKAAIIIFLNKSDLYAQKIKKINIADIPEFSDYPGKPFNYEAGIEYFLAKFLARNAVHDEIYHHVTCATDTSSVRFVFNACKDVITENHLKSEGFLS